MKSKLLYDVQDKLPAWKMLLYSIQHCLAMFVANTLISLIVYSGQPYNYNLAPAALISAGIGTIIYLFITKFKSPVFLGSSAALIPVMSSCLAMGGLVHGNFIAVGIGLVVVSLIYITLSIITKLTGSAWINKLLPPVIVGPLIAVIGLSLAGFATNWSMFSSGDTWNIWAVLTAFITMLIIAAISHYAKGVWKTLPFLIGLLGGYLVAVVFTLIGYGVQNVEMQLVDFSKFAELCNINNWLPNFSFQYMLDGVEANGFEWSQLPAILLIAIPVSLVAFCEHIGDHLNVSNTIDKNLLAEPGLHRTALGDGIATAVGGLVSGMGNTTYSENVSVIGLTKVASVRPILGAAVLAILLGFAAPVMYWVNSIPYAAFGGAALILYGFITVSGLRNLQKVDLTKPKNIIISSVILISGVGGMFLQFGDFQFSGVALAMILGVVLNLILREKE